MALANITIDFDLAQLLGSDFDARRTKAYVTTNVESGTLMDTSTGETRLGDEAVTIASDGTGSFTTWATGADGNPISWQTSLVVDYPRTGQRDRKRRVFGPWTLVAANDGDNITDLEDEQAVPAEYLTSVTTLLDGYVDDASGFADDADAARILAEAARDGAVAIAGPVDATVEALVKNTGGVGPLTSAAVGGVVTNRSGPAWVTGTAYKVGQVVVNPSGSIVVANTAHTAAASYATDTAKWTAVSANTLALAPSNGHRPVGRGELVLTPEDFGAVGNWNGTTGTDDTAAWTAMLTFMQNSGNTAAYIQLTRGKNYKVNALTPFVGLKIVGCGQDATISCTSGNLFNVAAATSVYNMTFEDVQFYSYTGGGHIFSLAAGSAMAQSKFHRCTFIQINAAKSVISGSDIGFIENTFEDCQVTHQTNATVPAFYLQSNAGGLNCNQWLRGRYLYSGNYVFWLESTNATIYAYDNHFEDINFEVTNGGNINILSGHSTRVVNCVTYDLQGYNSGVTTKDLYNVGKTATGLKSKYTTFENVQRRGGTLGSGLYDIKFIGGGAAYNNVIDCDTATLSGFAVYWGYENGYFRSGTNIVHTADDSVLKHTYDGLPQEAHLATVTGIDGKTVAVTNLFTVPTGRKVIVTKAVVRCTAAVSYTVAPTVGLGSDAGGVNTFAAEPLTTMVGATSAWLMEGKGFRPIVPAAGVVKLGITTGATATTLTLAVDLFGYVLA